MSQLAIVILSGSAIFLVGSVRRDIRRWGYLCGMASQPLYFHATWTADQWGMFMLAFWFTFGWSRGAWNHWRPEKSCGKCEECLAGIRCRELGYAP